MCQTPERFYAVVNVLAKMVEARACLMLHASKSSKHIFFESARRCIEVSEAVFCWEVLVQSPSARLLKHVVRCYERLCDNPLAKEVIRTCLPVGLKSDPSLQSLPKNILRALEEDPATKSWLITLRPATESIPLP